MGYPNIFQLGFTLILFASASAIQLIKPDLFFYSSFSGSAVCPLFQCEGIVIPNSLLLLQPIKHCAQVQHCI